MATIFVRRMGEGGNGTSKAWQRERKRMVQSNRGGSRLHHHLAADDSQGRTPIEERLSIASIESRVSLPGHEIGVHPDPQGSPPIGDTGGSGVGLSVGGNDLFEAQPSMAAYTPCRGSRVATGTSLPNATTVPRWSRLLKA